MAENGDEEMLNESAQTDDDSDWEEVRRLLVGQEQKQLAALHERLQDPVLHARDISEVLPQAILLSTSKNDALPRALTPAVESALRESVLRDPSALVNAIFPVIGPAIRKAIAEALARMVQTLNTTLEHSLSWRSWRWRWEAARTGRSFAEVVLCHTLVFRVEQVFLIHRRTGLLLQHLALPETGIRDTDMVSGMFTAIQDFVRDSFQISQQESLQEMRVGNFTVWVEAGPHAYLAAVIQGTAPQSLRTKLQTTLEEIHLTMGSVMERFEGDASSFNQLEPLLQNCLQIQYGQEKKSPPWKLVLLLLLLAAALAWWVWGRAREGRRWSAYLDRLRSEPGLVVTQTDRRGSHFYLAGLRDPFSADPEALSREAGLNPSRVHARWEPFAALQPKLVLARANQKLQPPEGVVVFWGEDRVLKATGRAPTSWINQARAFSLEGVDQLDLTGLTGPEPVSPSPAQSSSGLDLKQALEKIIFFFEEGTRIKPASQEQLDQTADLVKRLYAQGVGTGHNWLLWVIGHSDRSGREAINLVLSQRRAELVANELTRRGVPASILRTRGLGSAQPGPAAGAPGDRRVTFEVQETAPSSPE